MKQYLLIITFLSIGCLSLAQTTPAELASIKSKTAAEKYIAEHPNLDAQLFKIGFASEAAELFSQLYSQQPGYSFNVAQYTYKLIEFDSFLAFRVNYIYLDGSKLTITEINQLREKIIAKYRSGTSFADLASEYGMDGNSTGDTHWFGENVMAPEFETAIRAHKKGDIFTVDKPSLNWYHVVLKSNDEAMKANFTLFRVKRID